MKVITRMKTRVAASRMPVTGSIRLGANVKLRLCGYILVSTLENDSERLGIAQETLAGQIFAPPGKEKGAGTS